MVEILLLLTGASIALFSTWVKSWIEREAHCSNEIFKQRLSCLNKIWSSFYEVKSVYGNKIPLGHKNWLKSHGEDAEEKLNLFRKDIDESQIILSKEIISQFRELDTYLYLLLGDEVQKSSDYIAELNSILSSVSKEINTHMNKRIYKVDLHLKT